MREFEEKLVAAIQTQTLSRFASQSLREPDPILSDNDRSLLEQARAACLLVDSECRAAAETLSARFSESGLGHSAGEPADAGAARQFHWFSLQIPWREVDRAILIAGLEGYQHTGSLTGAGWRAFVLTGSEVTLIRRTEASLRLTLYWQPPPGIRWWPRALRPRIGEVQYFARWPAALWPLAIALSALRRFGRRLGGGVSGQSLGPLLTTPRALLPQLMTFAELSEDDVLLDLGSGDGRVVIEASQHTGCRGIGVEIEATLCAEARAAAASRGLTQLIDIRHADLSAAPVQEATVIFLFLPASVLRLMVPDLLQRMRPGARLLVHEQAPLNIQPPPERSRPMLSGSAITVAHLWTSDGPQL